MSKIWFITGSSRGLGRAFACAALSRGDRVAATARDLHGVEDLVATYGEAILPLTLDVRDRAAVDDGVQRTHDHFGQLDVVVNNAGYIVHGAVEELNEQDLRDQLETNLFGPLWVARAALPHLRRQGGGRIIQISSLAGVAAYPTLGAYHASKWAMEGLSESLAGEAAQFGIKVTIVEPGSYGTDLGAGAVRSAPLPMYDHLREALLTEAPAREPGDPAAAARALLRIADADDPPLRVIFGAHPYQAARQLYAERLDTWAEWAELSTQAQG
ncbi:NADP-dependent 3-hydroxy acid dehydrogenase YdfG [Nonomuraea solani]|uniref:NADP-dependent 3-hydroxy acid dehydrogenase YdfG n=1 Tax=Nonomuraea solani TaxID=1144553 RepID=A0A1H6EYM3_9ACTN|nr:SDR family NAD(P)-dependent oxidoreductase [Nonomuraea solani]SEH02990.1 NADP-dependent 3-hydroxy acid dehydrogenase YdfG [Nonomuraea solani]